MPKKKTEKEILETLLFTENFQDNLEVSNDYMIPEELGDSLLTMYLDGEKVKRNKGVRGGIHFFFDKKGRVSKVEIVTREVGSRKWQVATSKLCDF